MDKDKQDSIQHILSLTEDKSEYKGKKYCNGICKAYLIHSLLLIIFPITIIISLGLQAMSTEERSNEKSSEY